MRFPYYCAVALVVAFPTEAATRVGGMKVISHVGMCEASAAISASETGFDNAFVVANDEDNILRVYAAGRDGGPLGKSDLNGFLKLDPREENDKADLEAATWLGGKVLWLASHSRSGKKGKLREQRHQFFSTEISASNEQVTIKPVAKTTGGLLEAIARIKVPNLQASILPEKQEAEDLRPEKKGLNIEGMAAGMDGTSILIGLRNPLSPPSNAILLTLRNPIAVVENGEKPNFGEPMFLDLGGRGIRSLEYSQKEKIYYVVAGPVADAKNLQQSFNLYRWSGRNGEPATPVDGFVDAVASITDFHPEAMIVAPDGKRIRLLSDDGDICDVNDPKFRAVELKIE
jgi:hypothetical protein